MKSFVLLLTLAAVQFVVAAYGSEDLIYGYECQKNRCLKVELQQDNIDKAISLPVCRMFCGVGIGTLWPQPTGVVNFEQLVRHIDYENVNFQIANENSEHRQKTLWNLTKQRFVSSLSSILPNAQVVRKGGYPLTIVVNLQPNAADATATNGLTLDTDESYRLSITSTTTEDGNEAMLAEINALSYFGARHGLETLLQLIVYDDIRREVLLLAKAEITDAPVYKWRGLLLDTSRNFYSVKAIKRTLDAMAMVKLNTFHWHITDSHSFPFEVKSQPELYKLGAYSARKVYTHADISDIVQYGLARGIRVMPEFDAPAHVGEGWQHKQMTACFNAQPWRDYCVEPPCGQLDPTVDALYPVLEDIYREMFELFQPDVFHMGGDEVSTNCWNSSERIRDWMRTQKSWSLTEADFLRLWGYFQTKALERVDRVANGQKPPIILWTSRLTDEPFLSQYLDNKRYIIQIWTTGSDPKIKDILKRGFRVIVSNYDALYLDCGGPGWVTDGNNWCSPFIGWQKVYENKVGKITQGYESLALGAEAAVWSEQIDEHSVDYRIWPRASALAERLWSNPQQSWLDAEARMLYHRERLVEHGIAAEALEPEWCLQHENDCPIHAYNTNFEK